MIRVRHIAAVLVAMVFVGSAAGLGVMLLCAQPAWARVSFFDVDAKPREGPPAPEPPVTPPPVPPTPAQPQPPGPPVTQPPVPPPAPEPVVAPPKAVKVAPPDAATQEKNLKLARMIFEKEYAQNTPEARRQLVATLLDEAGNIQKNFAAKFVLLGQARDLAAETGDAASCRQAVEELDRGFVVDPNTMAAGVLARLLPKKGADDATLGWGVEVMNRLIQLEDYEAAARLLALCPAAVKDADLAARLKTLRADIAEYQRIKPMLEKLAANPADPDANLAAGRFYCFTRGDWAKGLPMLAKGSDAALRDAAAAELSKPTAAAAQLALANLWWEAAKTSPVQADAIRARAGTWYEKALPGLTEELEKVLAQKRLAELAAAPEPKSSPASLTLDLGKGVTMKLVLIRPGKFMMGTPDSEQGRESREVPQHEVVITKPFYMGVTEVTQAQYEAVMGTNPSANKGPTNPVEMVSWDEASDFCRKLSGKTGKTVRLPTEAEWEYACRAGSTTRFSFGDSDSVLGDYAWYASNSGGKTHPVGQKKPNAWGLYDMHGNVWEWCADWYGEYQKGTVSDPFGPASGGTRVLRGGSWGRVGAGDFQCAHRAYYDPAYRNDRGGFRVALGLSGLKPVAVTSAPVTPSTPPGVKPDTKEEWIDLLALIDPAKDAVLGKWEHQGTGIVKNGEMAKSRLMIPLALDGDYELEVRCTHLSGNQSIGVVLPVASTAAFCWLRCTGDKSQLSARDTTTKTPLRMGQEATVQFRVTSKDDQASIEVFVNGQPHQKWQGPLSELSKNASDWWAMPNHQCPGLVSSSCTCLFSSVRLRMHSGEARLLRPPPGVKPVIEAVSAAVTPSGKPAPVTPSTPPAVPVAENPPAPPAAPAALTAAKPYVIPITGALESHALAEAVEKALAEAKKQQATVIIFRLNTPGGRVDVADKLIQAIEGITWAKPVAFISGPDKRALSAGAYLCLACEKIYMVPGATMGAATPYTMTFFGPSVSEKFQSAFRARFRALAQARGHSVAVADAMVDRETGVVQVFLDGKSKLVSEREARRMAEQMKGRFKRGKTVCEAGQILTMTSKEAAEFGVAAGIVADEKELLAKMEMQAAQVTEAKWLPDWVAKTAAERKKAVDLAMQTFLMHTERAATFDQQADQATSAAQRRPLVEKGLAALQDAAKALTELERLAKDEKYDFMVSEDKLGELKARMEAMYGRMKALR